MEYRHKVPSSWNFENELNPLWGRTVTVRADISRRSVVEKKDCKGNSSRMPLMQLTDIHIAGSGCTIPAAVIMDPSLWRVKAREMDAIEFQGKLVKEKDNTVGFRSLKNIRIEPMQTKLAL